MAGANTSLETIVQLNSARGLALNDASFYKQIVPGVLPIVGISAAIELQRWGADFIAESLASAVLASGEKQQLSLLTLQIIRDYLESPRNDETVVKSAIQAATSAYPLAFRHVVSTPKDETTWQILSLVKTNILRRLDNAPAGVRVCCVRFIQRVIHTQTPGLVADPRRPEHNETSLSLVSKDHALLAPANLEAEASGLLDRLLIFLEEHPSNAWLITAILNGLGSLIRHRPSIANRILSSILNYNPFASLDRSLNPRSKLLIKSIEKTLRALLLNVIKKNPSHAMTGRIQQHLERLQQWRAENADDTSRKRFATADVRDESEIAKRQRLENGVQTSLDLSYFKPEIPMPLSQLYTLTNDEGCKSFDVRAIPVDIVVKILVPILSSLDTSQIDTAINVVRARYLTLDKLAQEQLELTASPIQASGDVEDEDEEYEPDYEPTEDAEQVYNVMDQTSIDVRTDQISLGHFEFPMSAPLNDYQLEENMKYLLGRMFDHASRNEVQGEKKQSKFGLGGDKSAGLVGDSWTVLLIRLLTRGASSITKQEQFEKLSKTHDGVDKQQAHLDFFREQLYTYLLEDFRNRIGVAVKWLSEEWYNCRKVSRTRSENQSSKQSPYTKWSTRLLDGMLPYIDARDKIIIRFYSELPELNKEILDRVKKLARDPDRAGLAVNLLLYLIMYRPPAREICLDVLESIWRDMDEVKAPAGKILEKWRPRVFQKDEMSSNVANTVETIAQA